MDCYDPRRRMGLVCDEWGTWWRVEDGTNPRFLYQQNALRDALVASLHFDIFHQHADRLVMDNIAQTVNVLQAMVLTDGDRLLKTPTFHVFEMNKGHHDAMLLPLHIKDATAFREPQYVRGSRSSVTTAIRRRRSLRRNPRRRRARPFVPHCLCATRLTCLLDILAGRFGQNANQ